MSVGDDLERRTVKAFEGLGYRAERVSRRSRFATSDLFGVIDIVAVNAQEIMFIQSTTKNNKYKHRKKIRDAALPQPVRLVVWDKVGGRWIWTSEEVTA